ncbi:hypothetical protein FLGE108171_15775 [Flavobacterium gelidilacus]|uniref:hypothetical protein n=1 Tax=Flavobacterium gelidilacus TaxID=206041 RepID=UPI0003FEFA23|nr:hypothetical protein [Flavobacterium gelidilacus]
MLEDKEHLRKIIQTVIELFEAEKDNLLAEILRESDIKAEQTHYDNWNGGIYFYSIYIALPVDKFVKLKDIESETEIKIKNKLEIILRSQEHIKISEVFIIPESTQKIDWNRISDIFNKDQLITELNYLKDTLISVSTGNQQIQNINDEYIKRSKIVDNVLKKLSIENPNPFKDLWQWYGRWSSGEMPKYQDRRAFIGEMFGNIIQLLQETEQPDRLSLSVNLSGWERIDRSLSEIKVRLKQAVNEEQYQTIGLLCRETIISLAQAIYNKEKHPTLDKVEASKTDAKRMLDAYISVELSGSKNEVLRKYARASSDLANVLTHKRTANSKDASLCASATISLINLIGILEDRH